MRIGMRIESNIRKMAHVGKENPSKVSHFMYPTSNLYMQ